MANIKQCDICKKAYAPYNLKRDKKRPNSFRFVNEDDGWVENHTRVDCCPECMVSIQNHITYLELVAREKEDK